MTILSELPCGHGGVHAKRPGGPLCRRGSTSLAWPCGSGVASGADGPELQLQAGELASDVHGHAPGTFELLPQLVVAGFELEVVEARVVGDLARGHRQRAQ